MIARCPAVLLLSLVMMSASVSASIADDERARTNWILNCQGCHRADASGSDGGAPNMAQFVARFLAVEGGREFLVRVPGVAHAPLPDNQVAELVNWMLTEFDSEHLPEGFEPYTSEEVARLRADPLIEDAIERRAELTRELERRSSQ